MTTPMRNPRVPGVFAPRESPAAAVHAGRTPPRQLGVSSGKTAGAPLPECPACPTCPEARALRPIGATVAGAIPRGAILAAALFALAGCQATDPLYREGLWRPTGANDANLRAMVAVPSDLAWGAAAPGGDGHLAARAVQRLRQGRTHPLHDVAISKVAPPRSGAAGSAAPAGAEAE